MARKNLSKTDLLRVLTAAAISALLATLSGCSNEETRAAVREDARNARAAVGVPRLWHNRPGDRTSDDAALDKKDAKEAPKNIAAKRENKPLKIPQSAAKDRLALESWWARFDDPVLDQLLRTALQFSPDLRSMLARVEEARARRSLTRADMLPKLTGRVTAGQDYYRAHRNYSRANSGSETQYASRQAHHSFGEDSYYAGLDGSWEIDLFGKYRAALAAASAEIDISEENFRGAQLSLATEVATTYTQFRAAEARLAIARKTLATREQSFQIAQHKFDAGTGDTLELRQAESALELARATVPQLEAETTRYKNYLAILTGNAPNKAIDDLLSRKMPPSPTLESSLAAVPTAPDDISIGSPIRALNARPDVIAAEKNLEAYSFNHQSAKTAYYPTLNLSGSIGVNAMKAGNLFSPDATVGSILAGLTQPIFDGFRIQKNIEIASIQQKDALINYEKAILQALQEVEDALVDVRAAADRLIAAKASATHTSESSRLNDIRFQTGQVDATVVLDSERANLTQLEQAVEATANRTITHINLFKSLGGQWTTPEQPTTTAPSPVAAR